MDDLQPPDDFRKISVLPVVEDINVVEKPFLRKNIIEGPYRDAEHYLDVQYRLLREDFIRPLRQGILEFRNCTARSMKMKNMDVKVYRKVKILKYELFRDDFVHYVKLNIPAHLLVENSKRLMFGNLVCISYNNFKSFHVGSIIDRKPEMFKKGEVGIKFETPGIDMNRTYDMVESRAYFEAYKHNLKTLQSLQNVPLPQYVLHVSNDLHLPSYMRNNYNQFYDLRVIKNFNLMSKEVTEDKGNGLFVDQARDIFEPNDFDNLELSQIMVRSPLEQWPSALQLGLDESQRAALYGALTRQLAIIQGPPGTGKTYLGLKITQILLHNRDKWLTGAKNKPILVVCYTNHALDQFLEGMLKFTRNIVRVGARSKSEEINKYQINNLLQWARKHRLYHQHLNERAGILRNDVRKCEEQLIESLEIRKQLQGPNGIFRIDTLKDHIPEAFIQQLLKLKTMECWLLDEVAGNNPFAAQLARTVRQVAELEIKGDSEDESGSDFEEDDWEDAQDYIQSQEQHRMIDMDANITFSVKAVNVDYIYDCKLSEINREIANLEGYCGEDDDATKLHYQLAELCKKQEWIMKGIDWGKKQAIDNPAGMKSYVIPPHLNIFEIPCAQRWQLYQYWIDDYIKELDRQIPTFAEEFHQRSTALTEVKSQETLQVMQNATVVGITVTGAAKLNDVIQTLDPEIVIIEEAAVILESHIITSVTRNCNHLILIGDHQQLRPSCTVYELAIKYNLQTSLFERMIKNGVQYNTLEYQHRMRGSISRLIVPAIYPELKDAATVRNRPSIKGIRRKVYFIDHKVNEDKKHGDDNSSHENKYEAHFLMSLCRHLLLQDYEHSQITILTPYLGQFFLLKKIQRSQPLCGAVKICVVDNYQGEENDIILLSLVRSNEEGNVGFLKIDNRVNVALSRAKNGLYIIGNMKQMSAQSNLWTSVKETLTQHDSFGPTLPLKCANHPEIKWFAVTGDDFQKYSPEGGCKQSCSFNFEECGHPCTRMCHARNMAHVGEKCRTKCLRKQCLNDDHLCQKECWQVCGPCLRPVQKELPCGHTAIAPCHVEPAKVICHISVERILPDCEHKNKMKCCTKIKDFDCTFDCDTRLDCGHQCRLKCHVNKDPDHEKYLCLYPCESLNKDCSRRHKCAKKCHEECGKCTTLVDKMLPCGHEHKNVKCFEKPEEIECNKPCKLTLFCSHKCPKKCKEICGGCPVKVDKLVPACGHRVKMECGKEPSLKYCVGMCIKALGCGHPCKNRCKENCTANCEQLVISRFTCPKGHNIRVPCHRQHLISEEEAFLMCSENCGSTLSCEHYCKGKCGECLFGRLHIPCKEPCNKNLVCGHVCKSPCSLECPPCKERCELKCSHNKCKSMCAINCKPCLAPCTYQCEHHECKKRCGEICDRDPCTVPCPKLIRKCGHPCIGFCGDPCPRYCRICDKEHLTEFILYGSEGDDDARFVLLPDCNHAIEVDGLEYWLNSKKDEIGVKDCPRCKRPIYNLRRYEGILQKIQQDVKKVKDKYFSQKTDTTLKEIKNTLEKVSMKYFQNEIFDLSKILGLNNHHAGGKKRQKKLPDNVLQLTLFKAQILEKLTNLKSDIEIKSQKKPDSNGPGPIQIGINARQYDPYGILLGRVAPQPVKVEKIIDATWIFALISNLKGRVMAIEERATNQMMTEFVSEIQRISILPAIKLLDKKKDETVLKYIREIEQVMAPSKVFSTQLEAEVKRLLKQAEKYIGSLGISSEDRRAIKAAIGMHQGHWYKCPNNHVYCIADCGQPNQSSKCPECKLPIGRGSNVTRAQDWDHN